MDFLHPPERPGSVLRRRFHPHRGDNAMRGKWLLVLAAVMVAALAGKAVAGGQVDMKPGKWEITNQLQGRWVGPCD